MSNVCQSCKKARATVHFTEIDDAKGNKPTEMHLCESCAEGLGTAKTLPAHTFTLSTTVIGVPERGSSSSQKPVCPECGMNYQEFRVKGRFGCIGCYDVFDEGLVPLLERVHGASQHVGPHPASVGEGHRSTASLEQELLDLRRRLSRSVRNENYEEAATLRDRIQEVESRLSETGDA